MNTFLNGLTNATNYTYTENGAITHKTTNSALLDLFAMGGAYRSRSEEDVIMLFRNAFNENPTYALKCLFYLRDAREGQGERRFFRVVLNDMARHNPEAIKRNMEHIPFYGRWDDLYAFTGTPLMNDAFKMIKHQLALDVECETPSLLAKWLPSENASSVITKKRATATRIALGMTPKQYRKTLSYLRKKINVLERLMSEGRWAEIEFDKIPSKAGLKYKNAFARHDVERAKVNAQTYADFAKDETKTVNAKVLYPYEAVAEAVKVMGISHYCNKHVAFDDTQRLMTNKYWDGLADYINGASFNGICVCDTSGSMTGPNASAPINVAISLALYCAEKNTGPFAGHYVSFASRPQLIKTVGVDFCDKVARIYRTNLCDNTNIEATFDLLLDVALESGCKPEEIPANVIIISDMEFDMARSGWYHTNHLLPKETLMESIARKWEAHGLKVPNLVFWNVSARHDNIPMRVQNGISFVSGMSPSIFEQIIQGKTAEDLMFAKLDSERYSVIN